MNLLPFGIPNTKSTNGKTGEVSSEALLKFDQKLSDYRDILERYKNCILEYSSKLEGYDRRTMDNQLSIVQTALDLTYIKEQGDKQMEALTDLKASQTNKIQVQLENMVASIIDTNYKLEGLDKNVVNRLSEIVRELQRQTMIQNKQLITELGDEVAKLSKSVKSSRALLWVMFTFNIVSLGAIAFLILYNLDLLPY